MHHRTFEPFPALCTARLALRALRAQDCDRLLALRSDPKVLRYMNREPMTAPQDAINELNRLQKGQQDGRWVVWAVCKAGEDVLMGTACLWNFDGDGGAEVGYDLMPCFQGKGYMAEALAAVLGYGFGALALRRVEARTHPGNAPSRRLLERLGFSFVGVESPQDAGKYEPNVIYEVYRPSL